MNIDVCKSEHMFPIIQDGIAYDILQSDDVEGAARCLAIMFSIGEPMTKSLSISEEEFFVFAELFCKKAVLDKLSIVAREECSRKVIGCVISEDFATAGQQDISNIAPKFMPILALLEKLDNGYRKQYNIQKNTILHEFMIGVLDNYSGLNIGSNLTELSHILGKSTGYKAVIAEATGPISQYIAINLQNYEILNMVRYHNFEYNKQKVFINIEYCENCMLIYKEL